MVERPLELADERSERAVVLAQKFEDFLRLRGLGEGGVATQVAEHDDDLAAVTFEDFLVALADDQLGELRREETLQPPDPAELVDLFGEPRLKATVQLRNFVGALTQFTQEPRVLHRDDGLIGESADEFDLPLSEPLHSFMTDREHADWVVLAQQRNSEHCPYAPDCYEPGVGVLGVGGEVHDMSDTAF